jgi:hypothetical protein
MAMTGSLLFGRLSRHVCDLNDRIKFYFFKTRVYHVIYEGCGIPGESALLPAIRLPCRFAALRSNFDVRLEEGKK